MSTTQQQPWSTAVATRTPMQQLVAEVRHESFVAQISNALPGNVTPERFVRVALTAIQQNPELVTVKRETLFAAIVRCAQDGLLPDGREAALVKFGNEAQYMSMIFGLRKIAANHGFSLEAHVVYAHDEFAWELGFEPTVTHVPPNLAQERGEAIGAYSVATDRRTGQKYLEVMSRSEIELVRKMSKNAGGPAWTKSWGEMARKTVARRNFKQLPLGDLDDREDSILRQADIDVEHDNGAMTVDEANIAAGLTNTRPPADKGPDDHAVERPLTGEVAGADTLPADREHNDEDDAAGEIVAEHDDEPVADAGQHGQLAELIVQLVDYDGDTDWRAAARQYATNEYGRPLDELRVSELEAVLAYLRAQLPPKTTTRRRTP